jgi:hypothetical protein
MPSFGPFGYGITETSFRRRKERGSSPREAQADQVAVASHWS